MNDSPVRRAARGATSPLRGFFNDHFEMVKAEIRAVDMSRQLASLEAVVADLESDLTEQSLHHARVMVRVRTDVEAMSTRIVEMERLVERLTDVVAAAILDDVSDAG